MTPYGSRPAWSSRGARQFVGITEAEGILQYSGSPLTLEKRTGAGSIRQRGAEAQSIASGPKAIVEALFHPAVATWFAGRFVAPTPAQAEAWPAIKARRHTLVSAPTGSGKTLAAFLAAIDDLVRQGLEGRLTDATQVVYVSPLKALSNDIHRNLEEPLAGIREELLRRGLPDVEIRTWVRTGDTPTVRARADAPAAAAYPRDDAGIALRSARLGVRPQDAGDSPHGDRRRNPCDRPEQARRPPDACPSNGSPPSAATSCCASACPPRKIRSAPLRIFWSAPLRTAHRPPRPAIVDAGHQRPRDLGLELPKSPLEGGDVGRRVDSGL